MNPYRELLKLTVDAFARYKVDYAVVGGLAVSAQTEPRFTRDIDFVVAVAGNKEAEALIVTMRDVGFVVDALVEQEATQRLATVRLLNHAWEGIVIDLLFASSGIEDSVVENAERIDLLDGVQLPVASVGSLLALKLLARDDETRPQDWVDITALLAVADEKQIELAKRSVRLIEERGFNRNRNLTAALDLLLV